MSAGSLKHSPTSKIEHTHKQKTFAAYFRLIKVSNKIISPVQFCVTWPWLCSGHKAENHGGTITVDLCLSPSYEEREEPRVQFRKQVEMWGPEQAWWGQTSGRALDSILRHRERHGLDGNMHTTLRKLMKVWEAKGVLEPFKVSCWRCRSQSWKTDMTGKKVNFVTAIQTVSPHRNSQGAILS